VREALAKTTKTAKTKSCKFVACDVAGSLSYSWGKVVAANGITRYRHQGHAQAS